MTNRILLTLLNSGLRILIGFLCLKLIGVYGEPTNIIQFGQIQSVLNILTTVCQLGLGYGILTIFKEPNANKENLLFAMIVLFSLSGWLFYSANWIAADFVLPSVGSVTTSILFLVALIGSIYVSLLNSYFVGIKKPSYANLIQIVSYLFALIIISVIMLHNILFLGIAVGLSNFLVAIAILTFIRFKRLINITLSGIKRQFFKILFENYNYSFYTLISVIVAQGT